MMKMATHILFFPLVLVFFLEGNPAIEQKAMGAPDESIPPSKADIKIPAKWFKETSGYEKALQIQKDTGADIFLVFIRMNSTDSKEKGRCRWFDKQGLRSHAVRKFLDDYIKVEISKPDKSKNEELVRRFYVNKCPAVFILHPDRWHERCKVFDWSEGKPRLLEPDELVAVFKKAGSAGRPLRGSGNPP